MGFAVLMAVSLIWYRSGRWKKAVVHNTAPMVAPAEIEGVPSESQV
jgi:hypothetical protein